MIEEVQSTFNYFKENPVEIRPPLDWHNYNQSQTKEKIFFMRLLRELCDLVEQQPNKNKGRKPVNTGDMIYSLALKTYETHSSRRACGELKIANKAGFIQKPFHFNTLLKYLENTDLTGILQDLIQLSSLPLKQVSQDVAADSTGFSTSNFDRWLNVRTKRDSTWRKFRKCHIICDVKTHVIMHAEITEGYTNDMTVFPTLVENAAKNFTLREISADKGYSSRANHIIASKIGAIAFIPFKTNTTGKADGSMLWSKMYNYFKNDNEHFMQHYHKRSNVESVFSMIKARFGISVRCKNTTSQDNEILLKVLCHNICVLIQEIFLNNVQIDFKLCAIQSNCT